MLHFAPDLNRAYHAVTKDWITNEIFRRIEPEGRTMGEYFQQEILHQFSANVHIRMDPEHLENSYDYLSHSTFYNIRNSMKNVGSYTFVSFKQLSQANKGMKRN